MISYFLKIFYALLLLLLHTSGFTTLELNGSSKSGEAKCIQRERQALLKFTQDLRDDSGMLSSWRDDENNRDCCKWKGIQCNNETGHVHILNLRCPNTQYLRGVINISLLIDLQNMEYLDLSNNIFYLGHIPESIGLFTKLKYLNLSYSEFGGMIPSKLGNLSQLRYLDLGRNHLSGAIPIQIGNLKQLQCLDLGGSNNLSGAIPFQIGDLPILHTLGLGGNFDINPKDAEWLLNLHFLTNLEFRSFRSFSHHWLQTISKLIPNLRELRLVDCGLLDNDISSLFHSHSNFSASLTVLDLSQNMLTSSIFHLLFNISHNLQELYLSNNNIVLSSSLYPNFPSLVILDLSYNNMTSSIFQGNLNFNSKLQKLSLRNCSLLDGSFLVSPTSTMNSSSSLLFLDLSSNLVKSSTIFYWLFNFTNNLQTLNLYSNLLEGTILDGFGEVMNSLQDLDLSYNKMQGEIPSFFGNMCTLQSLYLSSNNLSGDIASFIQNSSWCNKHVFQSLDLSYNEITGMVPESIGLLSELETLNVAGNSLEGEVTELHLANFSKLIDLSLSYNSLSLILVSNWVPPFQLRSLGLASCKLGPNFPGWLQTQSSLTDLDISDNGLHDSVPKWFWNNIQHMSELNMSHNNLIGEIPKLPLKLIGYEPSMIINSNQFEGEVPSFLRQASKLMLSENKFSNLSSFLCDQNQSMHANLAILDLANNQVKGQLLDCWKSVDQLLFLDLSNNKLSGNIPKSMGTLVKLKAVVLGNNRLIGELPSNLKNCNNLIMLDVGENMLTGPIPSWIGESMQQLIILIMRGNLFSGHIPLQLCYLRHIQMLDLSRNKLSKGIPTCLKNLSAMSEKSINFSETQSRIYWYNSTYLGIYGSLAYIYYKLDITWMWKGVEQEFTDPEFRLKSIDLSCNDLVGEIPKGIGYLLGLVSLNLSRNNLSGEIPFEIGKLSSLESLDLSRNHFSGIIPSSLSQIDSLGKLNLSHNSLSGRIPLERHFQTFDATSFEGNTDLCGEQLNKSCPGDQTSIAKPQGQAVYNEDSTFCEALYMSLGLGFFIGFWGLIGPILLWQPWRNSYVRFLNQLIDYAYVKIVVNVTKCYKWLED